MTPKIVEKKFFWKTFFWKNKGQKMFFSALFVSTLVMMHDDPPQTANVSRKVVHYSHVS